MECKDKIYVGAEIPGTDISAASTQELLDSAFARRARRVLQSTPLAIRQHPSAAPSPVLRWLLQMEKQQQQQQQQSTPPASVTPPAKADAPASSSEEKLKTASASPNVGGESTEKVTISQPLAASALARRGVGPKDPLMQRLLKKQQQQQQQNKNTAASSAAPDAGLSATAAATALSPSHWTQHPFSAMTATSWRVFRQQLGITIELVAPANTDNNNISTRPNLTLAGTGVLDVKVTSEALSAPSPSSITKSSPSGGIPSISSGKGSASSLLMPPAETLPAIRCWEEARLPLALGRVVATLYALPTAVQAQCVPLALLTSPTYPQQQQIQQEKEQQQQQQQQSLSSARSNASSVITATAAALGMDVLAVAETGSGKTAAYLVPMLSHVLRRAPRLLGHPERISLGPLSLVIVPTRELAEQVTGSLLLLCGQGASQGGSAAAVTAADIAAWEAEERGAASASASAHHGTAAAAANSSVAHAMGGDGLRQTKPLERNWLSELRVVKVVGGESRETQYNALSHGAHCVVGTVGQLQTLLEDRLLSLGNTQFVVMDEADRMLDEQQEAKLVAVLERCPRLRQTLMFTATLSAACARVAKRYLSRSGYYLVRTPYRCASIRQSFELVSDTLAADSAESVVSAAAAAARDPAQQQQQKKKGEEGNTAVAGGRAGQQQQQQRRLSALIHPQKFARLVTWLVYATGPIIIFANEKITCDALFDELRAEAEHLDAQQEYFSLKDLVEPPPDGLVFRESHEGLSVVNASAAASSPAASRHPSLLNLTSVAVVHSELSQGERRSLVGQFQRRQRQVLITTDLLARGLDVAGVTVVINYDLPWSATGAAGDALTLYIHRIGRTGRAGSTGVTVSFVTLPAAMVQRAEEVVKEEADGAQKHGGSASAARKNSLGGDTTNNGGAFGSRRTRGKNGADDDDADPMSLMGELFDGDTHNVWVTGVSAVAAAAATGEGAARGRGRKRLRDASDSDDETQNETRNSDGEENGNAGDDGSRGGGRGGARVGKRAKVNGGFASDVEVLRPLWSFLIECAEGEGCKDGAAALRRGAYAKINVPPALACIMAQLSATSQFGHITL